MIVRKKLKLPELPKRSLLQQFLSLYGYYDDKIKKNKTKSIWNKLTQYMNRLWKQNPS